VEGCDLPIDFAPFTGHISSPMDKIKRGLLNYFFTVGVATAVVCFFYVPVVYESSYTRQMVVTHANAWHGTPARYEPVRETIRRNDGFKLLWSLGPYHKIDTARWVASVGFFALVAAGAFAAGAYRESKLAPDGKT